MKTEWSLLLWVKLCSALKVKLLGLGLSAGVLAYVHKTLGSILSTGGKTKSEAVYSDTFV